jgi:hypothetical protein
MHPCIREPQPVCLPTVSARLLVFLGANCHLPDIFLTLRGPDIKC